jgi:hypothetical protein
MPLKLIKDIVFGAIDERRLLALKLFILGKGLHIFCELKTGE